jgi:serine O-acetyltransferase
MKIMPDLACTGRSLSIEAGMDLWATIHRDAERAVALDPLMSGVVHALVLRHESFADALACNLGRKLADDAIDARGLAGLIADVLEDDPEVVDAIASDLRAIRDRDPASPDLLTPFLYFKGFHALQTYRIGHWLWRQGRQHMARHMQSRASEVFAADIHPAARLGRGIMIDHGTGVVIGETAVVEDDVSMLQEVTLGGTGKETGDRHPKIRRFVLIGAGAKILGNIEVGEGAKVGAGSIVLDPVPPYTTVVGVPARPVGPRNTCMPALTMDQTLPHDYVI